MGRKARKPAPPGKAARTIDRTLPHWARDMRLWGAAIILAVASAAWAQKGTQGQPRVYSFSIKNTYRHDPDAFTQGLEFDKICTAPENCTEVFWESTGMNGESEMRLVELTTGKVLRRKKLDVRDFGEGMVRVNDRLLQLTWRTSKTLSYAVNDLEDVKVLQQPLNDGWGITHTGGANTDLVISDGTSTLTRVNPTTLQRRSSVQVRDGDRAVRFLNELEWVRGEVWANVWQTDCLARIDHDTGEVRGWVLLHELKRKLMMRNAPQRHPMDVLNGIAWDKATRRLFVTGKYWPTVYEVAIRPHPDRFKPGTLEMARQQCII